MNKMILCSASLALTGVAFAANPVSVGPTGDFATIRDAIASFSSTGGNAGETPPFIINVDPTSTYDEAISLDETDIGVGDIQGSIVIQSDTPGTLVPLAAQLGGSNDGVLVIQSTHDVTFIDFLMYPSTTNAFVDEIFRVDESAANNDFNTVTLQNCILTETDAAGVPLITDRAGAYDPPTNLDEGARNNAFASQVQNWCDGGESMQLVIDNTVLYACPPSSSGNLLRNNQVGQDGESLTITNSVLAYPGGSAAANRNGTGNTFAGTWNITGANQNDGPDTATVFISTNATTVTYEGSLAGGSGSTSIPVSYDGILLSGTNGIQAFGSSLIWDISVSNAIIACPTGIGIETNANTNLTFDNITVNSDEAILINSGAGTVTVSDSIFAGADDAAGKFGGASTATVNVDFCGISTTLPDVDPGSSLTVNVGSNIVRTSPGFVSLDIKSPLFYDVTGVDYAGAGTASSDLDGGADYLAFSGARNWAVYQ